MKIGILADIHGNANALEAVIADCNSRGIDSFILLGDLYSKGPRPLEVNRLLDKCNILKSIKGNTEKWFLLNNIDIRQKAFVQYGKKYFPEINQSIHKMNDSFIWTVEGKNILLIHYWPYNSKNIEHINFINENNIHIIISAHTHIPIYMDTKISPQHINPGSVGAPYDNDSRSSYGILDIKEKISFKVIRLEYDFKDERRIAINRNIPYLTEYLDTIGLKEV